MYFCGNEKYNLRGVYYFYYFNLLNSVHFSFRLIGGELSVARNIIPSRWYIILFRWYTIPKRWYIIAKGWYTIPKWWYIIAKGWYTIPKRWYIIAKGWYTIPKRWYIIAKGWYTIPKRWYIIAKGWERDKRTVCYLPKSIKTKKKTKVKSNIKEYRYKGRRTWLWLCIKDGIRNFLTKKWRKVVKCGKSIYFWITIFCNKNGTTSRRIWL